MTKPKQPRIYKMRRYIVDRRSELGLSQSRIAELIGMDRPTYNQIENGKQGYLMNATRLKALALALKLPVSVVVDFESEYFIQFCRRNNLFNY